MKDIRGAHVAAVRNAIFKTVGLTQLTSSRRKNSKDVMAWKSSKEVEVEYNNLYKDETLIENITAAAFPSLSDASDESFSDMYIYTASVCDIILNPNYPSLDIAKKALELQFKKFKVFSNLFILLFENYLLIKINILGSHWRKRTPWAEWFSSDNTGRNARYNEEEKFRGWQCTRGWRRGSWRRSSAWSYSARCIVRLIAVIFLIYFNLF